jgi:hypothetical protein
VGDHAPAGAAAAARASLYTIYRARRGGRRATAAVQTIKCIRLQVQPNHGPDPDRPQARSAERAGKRHGHGHPNTRNNTSERTKTQLADGRNRCAAGVKYCAPMSPASRGRPAMASSQYNSRLHRSSTRPSHALSARAQAGPTEPTLAASLSDQCTRRRWRRIAQKWHRCPARSASTP